MNSFRLLSASFVALVMAVGVTAGSLYITVDTAFRGAAPEVAEPPAMVTGMVSEATVTEIPLAAGGILKARFSAISAPSGALLPSAGLDVALIAAHGRRIQGVTDADGICSLARLSPGLYTITAKGVQGRISYGIRLTATDQPLAVHGPGQQWTSVAVGLDVVLDSALTPARDSDAIEQIINSVTVTPVTPRLPAVGQGVVETGLAQFDIPQEATAYVGHEPIQLNGNGSLDGQIAMLDPVKGQPVLITDLRVSFITDNTVVAETRVDPDGSFTQANLLPGIYSMVVAGKDGIGYQGVDVVGSLAAVAGPERAIPVRMTARASLGFGMIQGAGASKSRSDSEDSTEEPDDAGESADDDGSAGDVSDETVRQNSAAGAPGGSGSAGIGVGGGGTGAGDGLGLALGAAVGAAAALSASDDDDGRPASPAN